MFTTHRVSHVTCHVSSVMCHVIYFLLQSGGGIWWKGCYQWGLPCLVLIMMPLKRCVATVNDLTALFKKEAYKKSLMLIVEVPSHSAA